MRSIVILGAGELGGALARQLAAADVASRVTLVDESASVAEGKALDIRQAAAVDRYSTLVLGTSDESAAVGADLVVIADRVAGPNAEWQGDAGMALVRRLAHMNHRAMFLCSGAAHLEVVERGVREAGIARHRLIGSAPEALRSAVVSMTALEAGCSPMDVCLTVIGRPPREIIVPWEDASIGGSRAAEVLSPPAITRLDARLPRLWPPGPLTLASAAARFVAAAARASARSMSAFVVTGTEVAFGRPSTSVPGVVGMLPVTISTNGIAAVHTPSLSTRDRVRLDTALQR